MASVFSNSAAVCLSLSLLVACAGEDPNSGSDPSGGSSSGGTSPGGSAGSAGTPISGGTTAGGSSAGVGGVSAGAAGGGGAATGGSGGQAQGGSGGAAGSAGMAGSGGGMGGSGGTAAAPFLLTSPAFEHVEACSEQNHTPCKVFPNANIMMEIGGDNVSPELNWGPGPVGTLSYVITLHDFSNSFTHWAIWNIPAATLKLAANLPRQSMPATPAGSQQKSFNKNDAGYMGPGATNHIYEFRLYALKAATFAPQSPGDQVKIYEELEADMAKIVLGKTMLRGRSPN